MKIKFNKQFKNTKEKNNKKQAIENIKKDEKNNTVLNPKNYTKVTKNKKEVKYYSSASNEILKYKRINKVSKPNAKKRVRIGNTQNSEISNKNKTEKKIVNINMKKQFNNLFKNQNKLSKAYYFLLVAMVVLGAGSVYLVNKTYNLSKEENYAVYEDVNNNEGVSVYSSTNNQNVENTNKTEEKDKVVETNASASQNTDTKNTNNTNATNTPKKNTAPKVEPLSFSKPVQGEVLKVYSIDKVIYSKTLELWKTHDGVDIQASIGQSVKSIEKGTIKKVYEDSFYGMTIVIDHGQGYISSYSNLDTSITVKEKQTIKKGQVIGKISNTAIGEIKDDSHLHFMLFKDNQNIDPTSILK